jgi:hypothetical protein
MIQPLIIISPNTLTSTCLLSSSTLANLIAKLQHCFQEIKPHASLYTGTHKMDAAELVTNLLWYDGTSSDQVMRSLDTATCIDNSLWVPHIHCIQSEWLPRNKP